MDQAVIFSFIRRQRYGVVSSVSADGVPQSALVGISVTAELRIVFDTLKTSRKYPNLTARPACSMVLGWSGEQTVQLEGIAEEPRGEDGRRYREAYFAAWPDAAERATWPAIAYLVIHPRWIRYSDFDRRPPLIEEFALRE